MDRIYVNDWVSYDQMSAKTNEEGEDLPSVSDTLIMLFCFNCCVFIFVLNMHVHHWPLNFPWLKMIALFVCIDMSVCEKEC